MEFAGLYTDFEWALGVFPNHDTPVQTGHQMNGFPEFDAKKPGLQASDHPPPPATESRLPSSVPKYEASVALLARFYPYDRDRSEAVSSADAHSSESNGSFPILRDP